MDIECGTLADPIRATGSELACLRLYRKYLGVNVRVDYSKNLESWVFTLTPKMGGDGLKNN